MNAENETIAEQIERVREVLTDAMLIDLGEAARQAGDTVMWLRCCHALVDDLARRDVAIIIVQRHGLGAKA